MVVFMFDSDYVMNDLFMYGLKRNGNSSNNVIQ